MAAKLFCPALWQQQETSDDGRLSSFRVLK
ncbi:hypothetical protein CCACVL1_22154 [Corchorus capsularis]|uniref:Uncharacterized protein n=1 Tax=Corchorus capsularis TaxID=210143 RepID=A0A1R3H0S2_COCAP|nr:hypothetical protein CCACVL1_22154 [Corchorus capsularis]